MTAYYCRGTKGDGSLCEWPIVQAKLFPGSTIKVRCSRGECGHHENVIGVPLAKKAEMVVS